MISEMIKKLQTGTDLTYNEMNDMITDMLSGRTGNVENADFLSALTAKGETDDELLGMLDRMQELSLRVDASGCSKTVIDMCGTGGDGLETLNISTAASFVAAAAGATVAKHGNRSSTGVSGSADIFEYFGYDLNSEPARIAEILKRHGICFMFAQKFHPAMRHVAAARKSLAKRTAFNLLGPLSNPAGVKSQLVGVSSVRYLERLPRMLERNGAKCVMTVRSDNGMDEFSTSAANRVCMLKDGKVTTSTVRPKALGLHESSLRDIQVRTRQEAVTSFVGVLANTANRAMTETVALNAAGGLVVAGVAETFKDATNIALNTIRNGKAYTLLEKFIEDTGDITKLREIDND